jgi:disulfide bond formation protein DsbB
MEKEIIAQFLNNYLSLATIIGAAGIVLFAIYTTYTYIIKSKNTSAEIVVKYVLPLGFLATFGATTLSLFYSEYLLYAPCSLCWYQRIFMYSLMFLFGFAWFRKDKSILPYTLFLSMIGFVIALYHHLLQIGYNVYKPCSTAPFAIDCAKPSFIEYGFVTFPFMAVVLFGFLITITIISQKFVKNN